MGRTMSGEGERVYTNESVVRDLERLFDSILPAVLRESLLEVYHVYIIHD